MAAKQDILDLPRALRETVEKGRSEYEALVRRTRWGEGPIYILGSESSLHAGMTGAYAFEGLLGWPVIARSPLTFATYSLSVLRPRSVLIAISPSGESTETLEAARAASARGANLLALTNNPNSALAKMAGGVFLLRVGENETSGIKTMVCEQAAMSYISLVAARIFKRHHAQLDVLEEEFQKLAQQVDWVFTQMRDAVRSFASQLKAFKKLCVVGGGFYHPTALQGALQIEKLARVRAEGFDPQQFRKGPLEILAEDCAVILVSGSRCRIKKDIYSILTKAGESRLRVLSVTDRNDRELAHRSTLSVLLPPLTEMVGSVLAHALLQWVAYEMAREPRRPETLPHSGR